MDCAGEAGFPLLLIEEPAEAATADALSAK
jgi:hypothetical protein